RLGGVRARSRESAHQRLGRCDRGGGAGLEAMREGWPAECPRRAARRSRTRAEGRQGRRLRGLWTRPRPTWWSVAAIRLCGRGSGSGERPPLCQMKQYPGGMRVVGEDEAATGNVEMRSGIVIVPRRANALLCHVRDSWAGSPRRLGDMTRILAPEAE